MGVPKVGHAYLLWDPLRTYLTITTMVGSACAGKEQVTTIKLVQLGLDDDFVRAMGESFAHNNDTMETLVLDRNVISGAGIQAWLAGIAKNSSVVDLQVQ